MTILLVHTNNTISGDDAFLLLRSTLHRDHSKDFKPRTKYGTKFVNECELYVPALNSAFRVQLDDEANRVPQLNTEIAVHAWTSDDIKNQADYVLKRELTYDELFSACGYATDWTDGDSWSEHGEEICRAVIIEAVGHYVCTKCGKKVPFDDDLSCTDNLPDDDGTETGFVCPDC